MKIRMGITTTDWVDNGVDLKLYPNVENPDDMKSTGGYTHETVQAYILYNLADYFNVELELVQLKNSFTNLLADYNLDVLNVSYSTIKGVFSEKAIDMIPCKVVTSAGNEAIKGETHLTKFDNVISVGAVDQDGNHLDFSSYGLGYLDYVCVGSHNVNGKTRQGTSYASPVFAFLYALISKYTNTPIEVINSLVVDVDEHGVDLKTGLGWLRKEDVKKWIEEVQMYPSDIKGHWAEETFKKYIDMGAIKGYPDGTVKPDEPPTRAEMLTFFDRMQQMNS